MEQKNPHNPQDKQVPTVALDASSPSVSSIVRVVIVTLIIVGIAQYLLGVISALKGLLLLVVLSILFAYLIHPLVRLIRRPFKRRHLEKFMPRAVAIVVAYLIVFSVVGLAISALAPKVTQQGTSLAQNLPRYAKSVETRLDGFNKRLQQLRLSKEIQETVAEKSKAALEAGGETLATLATSFALSVLAYSPWLILIPVLSFLFIKDVGAIRIGLLRLFPVGKWRSRADSVLGDVNSTLAAYTRAQLMSCFLIGVVCTVAFYTLGIEYALIFGILAGVLEFIPLLGPLTVGVTVTGFTAFGDDPSLAVWVAAFLIVLRIVHDYVTYPRIIREGIHLHPLAIILSILAGEQIAGIIGVFLSIPIVALGTVIHRHVLEHSGSRGLFTEVIDEVGGDRDASTAPNEESGRQTPAQT
jgi:predicted PurR-regulated permease PerM